MYVYKFIENKQVVYVGKSVNYKSRFKGHDKLKNHFTIEVAKCKSRTDMDIYEIYYINKYNPILNTSSKHGVEFSLELKELEFEKIDFKRIKKKKIEKVVEKVVIDKADIIKDSPHSREDSPKDTLDNMRDYIEYDKSYLMYRMTITQRLVHMLLLFFESDNCFISIDDRTLGLFNFNMDQVDRHISTLYFYNLIESSLIAYNENNHLELWTTAIKKEGSDKVKITKSDFMKMVFSNSIELNFKII